MGGGGSYSKTLFMLFASFTERCYFSVYTDFSKMSCRGAFICILYKLFRSDELYHSFYLHGSTITSLLMISPFDPEQ